MLVSSPEWNKIYYFEPRTFFYIIFERLCPINQISLISLHLSNDCWQGHTTMFFLFLSSPNTALGGLILLSLC